MKLTVDPEEEAHPEPENRRRWEHNPHGSGLPGGEQKAANAWASEADSTSDNPPAVVPLTLPIGISTGNSPSALPSASSVVTINTYPKDENDHRYVGLVNQAMTCYLNSLIQSLYMTPEFRNAMYDWEYVTSHGSSRNLMARKGELSIPCQLQKLFLFLQTTDMDAYETKDLTASFGWSGSEAYDQHDVQELCRLMFDALEHKWKGTIHEKLIQDLYQGTMEDFVKCLNCGKENVRIDYFLDLPLAVKPFGMTTAYRSVEEALRAFVAPELLDGSNQYSCENCQKKQDAHKGLRITKFPYLLTIQLKRFDFDYNTMHRIKLNDKMTFPDVLDLNSFVYKKGNTPERNKKTENVAVPKEDTEANSPMDFGSPPQKTVRSSLDEQVENPYKYREYKEVRVGEEIDQEAVSELLEQGENVYELFSVMVHSGSAAGGHYFAHIKNMEQDKWYTFNDTSVSFASYSDIERSFGGPVCGWNMPNTNAYMLMYRKIDRTRNARFIRTTALPPHIRTLQNRWKEQEKEEEEQRKLQDSLLSVHVALNYPFPSAVKRERGDYIDVLQYKFSMSNDFVDYVTEISRHQPIMTVFNQAFDFFNERTKSYGITLVKNNSRLIYTEGKRMEKVMVSKADMEKRAIRSLFSNQSVEPIPLHIMNFLLDCRVAAVPFVVEPDKGSAVKIQRVDIAKQATAPEFVIYVNKNEPVVRVKSLIGAQFRDDVHAVFESRLVLEGSQRSEFLLIDEKANGTMFFDIIQKHIGRITPTIFYDGGIKLMCSPDTQAITDADRKKPFEKSTMFEILDRRHFAIHMKIRFPSPDEITRSASASGTYTGPTWAELHGYIKEEEQSTPSSQSSEKPTQDSPARENAENVLPEHVEDENGGSGRVSTASMRSISMEELDGGEAEIRSGSFCNNTPQMSPSVSEGDEYESSNGGITLHEIQNQVKAERTLEYMTEQHFQPAPVPGHTFTSPAAKRAPFNNEETMSEAQSLVSSGASTLIPSTSASLTVTEAQNEENPARSKITVVFSNDTYHHLDVDSRMKVRDLKAWIAEQLNVDKGQFVMVKHTSDDGSDTGYECNPREDENIQSAFQACLLSIKLRAPLKDDERMVQVIQFDMHENNRENWRTLFEIPASEKTLIGDFLLQCLRMYKEIYGEELTPQQVRLRDINTAHQSVKSVLNPNKPMSNRSQWSSNIFLQIITDESLIGKPGEPILVRRFRPSTVEVSQTHEVLVDASNPNQALAFLESLSKLSQIPIERLAVIDQNSSTWAKWPYHKSLLEMLDGKTAFTTNFHETYSAPEKFIARTGPKVIYYKDSDEPAKILTEDERKQIKIKENGQSTVIQRRKERPLRIQMSSVCEP